MSSVLIKYILMAAMRDRLVWGIAALFLCMTCLAFFSASVAIVEQGQFVVTYMAGGLRVIALLGLILFTIFFVRRSFDSRDVEFLLTRPVSRSVFVVSHVLAFSLLAIGAGAMIALLVGAVASQYASLASFGLWAFGVTFELMIVVATAFFFSMVLGSPVSAGLATFGFYILARLMGQVLSIFHHAAHPDSMSDYLNLGAGYIAQVIAVVVPRLDLMAQTSWLIYGGGALTDWMLIVAQGLVFIILITVAAIIDLRRKQF